MPLIKKCDVNEYFAARRRARLHPLKAASQRDTTAIPAPEPGAINAKQSRFAKDFLGEHSSPEKSIGSSADKGRSSL